MQEVSYGLYFLLSLVSGFTGAYVTHRLSIIRAKKELTFSEKFKVYQKVMELLEQIISGAKKGMTVDQLNKEIRDAKSALLLFAPDKIIKKYNIALEESVKTKKAKPLVDFFIEIRKDMIHDTKLTREDIVDLTIESFK